MTIAFFSINGIDILGELDSISIEMKQGFIEWIYHLQVLPVDYKDLEDTRLSGFQVSDRYLDYPSNDILSTYTLSRGTSCRSTFTSILIEGGRLEPEALNDDLSSSSRD